jgi:putative toxin-antitoxin system antitoxin component (TIGR02293 family)
MTLEGEMEREAAKAGASIAGEGAPGPAPRGLGHGAVHPAVALLGLRLSDPAEIVKRVGEGFSFHALERFQKATRIPTDDLAEVVAIKPRTLHRRKREGRLDPEESDRLLRVSRVFARALDLFEGDADAARRWFYAPARALGGERPIDFARTDLGSREIEALIDRLEQGVLT